MNLNDLLINNKIAIKMVALLFMGVLIWLNRKFNLGMTKEDIQSAALVDASFIIGVALHKSPTPDTPSSSPLPPAGGTGGAAQ